MSKPLKRSGFRQGLYDISSVRKEEVGTLRICKDGTIYRYCRAGSSALAAGKMGVAASIASVVTNFTGIAAAVGTRQLQLTIGSSSYAEDYFAGGYLQINDADGEGIRYPIEASTAVSSGTSITIALDEGIKVALTTSSELTLVHNPGMAVIEDNTSDTVTVVYDASADSNGSILYVQMLPAPPYGILVSPNAAYTSSYFTTTNGEIIPVIDRRVNQSQYTTTNDASGTAVYVIPLTFDHQLKVWIGKLVSVQAGNTPTFVSLTNGDRVPVWDGDEAAIDGLAVQICDATAGASSDCMEYGHDANAGIMYGEVIYVPTVYGRFLAVSAKETAGTYYALNIHTDNAFHINGVALNITTVAPSTSPYQYGRMFNVYCDEDATHPYRLICNNATAAMPIWVPSANGKLLKIGHDASADSNGVQVYFDDDGSTVAQRLLCDLPADANNTVNINTPMLRPVGVPLVAVTANYYYWAQTGGDGICLINGTPPIGSKLTLAHIAGALAAADSPPANQPICAEMASVAGVDTEYYPVKLLID